MSFDPDASWPVVMLGLRDEAVDRPWDPPAAWWPERSPHVRGVRDREAGGAWLAVNDDTARAAVVLNRHEDAPEPRGGFTTRGALPLDAVDGHDGGGQDPAPPLPTTRAFNLVEADPRGIRYTTWDGAQVSTIPLAPGTHMITHEGPDVASVPRELRWLPEFRRAHRPDGPLGAGEWEPWLDVLRASSSLPTDDDEALFRSDEVDGHRYASLSVSIVALRPGEVQLRHARLEHPGHLEGGLDWR
jgi:hypothetical protein